MNKKMFLALVASAFILLSAIVTFFLKFIPENMVVGFVLGFSLLALSMILGIALKRHIVFNIISLVLSSISLSYFVLLWCVYKELEISFLMLFENASLAILFIFIFYSLMLLLKTKKDYIVFGIVFDLIGLAIAILFLVNGNLVKFSCFGLYLIVALALIWGVAFNAKTYQGNLKYLSILGFAVFIVGLIVLIAIAGGDGLGDGLDISIDAFGGGGGKKKEKTR